MKKGLLVLCCITLILAMTGCGSVRTYVATKERVDVEVSGNQGVIYGPTPAPHKVQNPTRDICTVDVELLTKEEVKTAIKKKPEGSKSTTPDKGVEGNAGVVSQKEEKIK